MTKVPASSPPRPGSATAAPWIRSPLSLLVRLTRGVGAGWIVAAGLFAFAFGYLTQQMSDLTSAAGGQASNVDATLTVFVQMNALLAAAAGLQISQWLAREETSGRIGHILAAPVSRTRWWTSATVLVTGWSLLLLSCAGLFTGLGLTAGFNDWSYLGRGLTATLAYSPAVILFAGIAAALSALSPRMVALAWLAIGWGTIVCLRADLLRIPGWARHLSPLDWMGSVPGDAWDRLSRGLDDGARRRSRGHLHAHLSAKGPQRGLGPSPARRWRSVSWCRSRPRWLMPRHSTRASDSWRFFTPRASIRPRARVMARTSLRRLLRVVGAVAPRRENPALPTYVLAALWPDGRRSGSTSRSGVAACDLDRGQPGLIAAAGSAVLARSTGYEHVPSRSPEGSSIAWQRTTTAP
nr:hypothetical protein GCM10020092_080150 [Actinoplanes digitatis]